MAKSYGDAVVAEASGAAADDQGFGMRSVALITALLHVGPGAGPDHREAMLARFDCCERSI
ncbi:MAG: hypothetical protein ACKOEC_12300 [Acidimicrobiia bacterium]